MKRYAALLLFVATPAHAYDETQVFSLIAVLWLVHSLGALPWREVWAKRTIAAYILTYPFVLMAGAIAGSLMAPVVAPHYNRIDALLLLVWLTPLLISLALYGRRLWRARATT